MRSGYPYAGLAAIISCIAVVAHGAIIRVPDQYPTIATALAIDGNQVPLRTVSTMRP